MCEQLPWYRDKHFYFVKKEFGLCLLFALFSLERLVFDTGSGFFGALPGELEGYAVPWKVPREFFLTQVRSTVGGSTGVFLFYAGRVVPWEAPRVFFGIFLVWRPFACGVSCQIQWIGTLLRHASMDSEAIF